MKKLAFQLLTRILTSKALRSLVNPGHARVPKKIDRGNVCLILASNNRLGDMVIHNFLVQQLQMNGYCVSYGLSSPFFATYRSFFDHHSLVAGKDLLVLPENKWQWIGFILRIRRKKISAVILDSYPLIGSVFFYLAGVPVIIAPGDTKQLFFTHKYTHDKANVHYTRLAGALLELLGNGKQAKDHRIAPFFPFVPADVAGLEPGPGGLCLTVHMGGSNHWNRKWPTEKYLEVCTRYLQHYQGKLFLIGGREEQAQAEDIKETLVRNCNADGRVTNFCGVDLNTTANVLAASTVFIGNDSGPMHIANALNKRIIGIFGPSQIKAVNPTGYDARNVTIHAQLPCVPCLSLKCRLPDDKKYSCFTEVTTETVWKELQHACNAGRRAA